MFLARLRPITAMPMTPASAVAFMNAPVAGGPDWRGGGRVQRWSPDPRRAGHPPSPGRWRHARMRWPRLRMAALGYRRPGSEHPDRQRVPEPDPVADPH